MLKKNIINKFLCFGLISLLISCKSSLNYWADYARDGKKFTYLKNEHKKVDTLHRMRIQLCKEEKIPILGHTNGSIIFNSKSANKAIQNSIKKHFELIEYHEPNSIIWNQNCENFNAKEYKSSKDYTVKFQALPQKNNLEITLKLNYMTRKNIDYGAFFDSSTDLGNDSHEIKYNLVLSLFKDNNLEYMYNQSHWTVVLSKRGQNLNYEIPQKVIDSLVTLSLEKYYERVE